MTHKKEKKLNKFHGLKNWTDSIKSWGIFPQLGILQEGLRIYINFILKNTNLFFNYKIFLFLVTKNLDPDPN